ncbi:hypothetical protein DH2020_035305 [Rehmannia glutinosa]|uniref:Uncharacterized protein n=1 Tax=Rehmannia glutinosa TaxID=99300 RepID=A0ABR0V807_REHGL
MALRRTSLTALTNRNIKWYAFSNPLEIPHRYSTSTPTPSSCPCTSATDQVLLDDEAASVVSDQVETIPTLLQSRVIIYDGVCHLCHADVKWVIGADRDRKVKFFCLQSKGVECDARIYGLKREDVLPCFLFVEGPGSYLQVSAGEHWSYGGEDRSMLMILVIAVIGSHSA